jgi:DNA-directed RNA polymerase beta subunit
MSEAISLIDKYINQEKILKTIDDYPRNKQQVLFRRIISKVAGSYNSIEGYNNWVTNVLPEQIKAGGFTSPDGTEISFTDVFLNKPTYVKNNKEEVLYPNYSRKYKYRYVGKLEAVCIAKKNGKTVNNKIILGEIPIMLGSIKCNLHNKTPEELIRLGECFSDPFGYFITSSERSIITHDKFRCNLPLLQKVTKTDISPVIKETYNRNCITQIMISKKINAIKISEKRDSAPKDIKHTPFFILMKILTDNEPEEIITNYLFRFIDTKYHQSIRYALIDSIFKYNKHPDPYEYVFNKRSHVYKEKYPRGVSKQQMKDIITDDLDRDTYSNYNDIKNTKIRREMKAMTICFLVSKMLLFMIGEINIDSKDSWSVKRFENAPILVSNLIASIFKEAIKKCRKNKDKNPNSDYFTFGELLNSISSNEFKRWIDNSFNTSSWGVRTSGWQTENHAESTRRETPLALWSQTIKNTNNTPTCGQIVGIRLLQSSQRNRHCIVETPEGKNVGIVKYNCLTGLFSVCSEDKPVIDLAINNGGKYGEMFDYLIMVNGKIIHNPSNNQMVYVAKDFKKILINEKRKGNIPLDSEIVFAEKLKVLQVYTDSSRTICPYLIVNQETKKLVIDEMDMWDADFNTLMTNGCMEYLSAAEEDKEEIIISKSVENFYEKREKTENAEGIEKEQYEKIFNYSHCCIDPVQIYSVSSSTCPLSNHQPSPRSTYQAAMGKQALGYYNINYHLKFPKEFKRLFKCERSFTETDTYFLPKMDIMPSGQIANIAMLCDNDNQEDAIVVSEDFINSGKLNYIKYKVFEIVINTSSKSGGISQFRKPDIKANEDPRIYRHLQENGFPRLDSKIEIGDCILGRIVETPKGVRNESIKAELDMSGYVDRINIVREGNGRSPIIRIKLRSYRKYQAGDKLALRYAQKGTVGRVVKREEMPVVTTGPNKGIIPDILFNPIGFPKRQTVGLLIEGILTKAAIYGGQRMDVTAFRKIDVEKAKQILRDNDLDENGVEDMAMPDGSPLESKVFFVPLYEQALRHHVLDKIQFRNTGPRDFKTHQPQGGRARGSGLKVGEMEKDAFAAHGASAVIQERMMKSSDEFKLIVCGNCGSIIDAKVCRICDNSQPGILLIPYVFKVFLHLMMAINMDIRLKTEKIKRI